MLHYHVWFDLKPEVAEADGLRTVATFLRQLTADQEAVGFELLRNQGGPPRSTLPAFHALVRFRDGAQLAAAMRAQAARGIHTGPHGAVVAGVTNFHVEIFETVTPLPA